MQLPIGLPTAQAWELLTFDRATLVTAAAAGGACEALGEQVPDDQLWLLDRVVLTCTSTTPTTAYLYEDSAAPSKLRDASPFGNLDVADQASPIQLPAGAQLLVRWTGASDGAVGTAHVQYRVLRQAA